MLSTIFPHVILKEKSELSIKILKLIVINFDRLKIKKKIVLFWLVCEKTYLYVLLPAVKGIREVMPILKFMIPKLS